MAVMLRNARRHLLLALAVSGLLGLGYGLLSADAHQVYVAGRGLTYQCQVKLMAGWPCPGCGGTRSFILALHGDWGPALRLNPVGAALVAGLALFGAAQLVLASAGFGRCQQLAARLRRLAEPKYIALATYVLVALALGQWLIKIVLGTED